MKTIKKLLLLFALIFSVTIINSQTRTINAKLKVKNVPLGESSDSVVVIKSNGLLRHIPKSTFLSNLSSYSFSNGISESNGSVKLGGLLNQQTDIIIGPTLSINNDGDFNFDFNGDGSIDVQHNAYNIVGGNVNITPIEYLGVLGNKGLAIFDSNGFKSKIINDQDDGLGSDIELTLPIQSGQLALVSQIPEIDLQGVTDNGDTTTNDINILGNKSGVSVVDGSNSSSFLNSVSLGISELTNQATYGSGSISFAENNGVSNLWLQPSYGGTGNKFLTLPYVTDTIAVKGDIAFKTLDEGNGIGFVPHDFIPENMGSIGLRSLNFNASSGPSTTKGATGNFSADIGFDNTSSGYSSMTRGYANTSTMLGSTAYGQFVNATGQSSWANGLYLNASGTYNFINGEYNDGSGFASAIFGSYNTETAALGRTLVSGQGNVTSISSGLVSGIALQQTDGLGTIVLGTANQEVTANGGSATEPTNPILIVGNGTHTAGAGAKWNAITRSNLIVGLRNGEVTLPSTDISDINQSKSIVTKEYYDANKNNVNSVLTVTPVGGFSEINTGSGLIIKSNPTGEIITLGDTEPFTFNALSSTFSTAIIDVTTVKATDVDFSGIPQFDNDALAGTGGVSSGFLYKTSTGEIRIKL